MLSVLIPTYNYDTRALVAAIHQQAQAENIPFEIIVADDASTQPEIVAQNTVINQWEHVRYWVHPENIGRSANRNFLADQAQHAWILFLDADTQPVHDDFIRNYLQLIRENRHQACFGGIAYQPHPPKKEELLRWIYGKNREARPVSYRRKHPYASSLVSNFLIQKAAFAQHRFDPGLVQYGFEDFIFIAELEKNHLAIAQIENPVYHLNCESSADFLSKHLEGIQHLHTLMHQHRILPHQTTLGRWHLRLQKYHLDGWLAWIYQTAGPWMRQNLRSSSPSLFLFDLYKLGYFCSLKN